MNDSATIPPDLQAAVMCEDVRQEMGGGQTLVGVLNVVPAPVVPMGIFKLEKHGLYHVEIRLDGNPRLRFPLPVVPVQASAVN
jgi:hypothetical protein